MVTGASTEPSAKGSSASRRDWSPIGPSTCGLAAGSSATAVTLARPARKADASKAMRIRTPSNHRREPLFILVAGFDFCFTVICLLPSVCSLELAEVRTEDTAAYLNQDEGENQLGTGHDFRWPSWLPRQLASLWAMPRAQDARAVIALQVQLNKQFPATSSVLLMARCGAQLSGILRQFRDGAETPAHHAVQ